MLLRPAKSNSVWIPGLSCYFFRPLFTIFKHLAAKVHRNTPNLFVQTDFWGEWVVVGGGVPVYEQRQADLATFRAVPSST